MRGAWDASEMVAVCSEGAECINTHQDTSKGVRHVREIMAGAGAHEGHIGCIWDGGGTLRRGWACQRSRGMSRGMGCVLGGHGAMARGEVCSGCVVWHGSRGPFLSVSADSDSSKRSLQMILKMVD